MSKYIDLAEQIHTETRDGVYMDEVGEVLEWLDRNPDQAPGRTITESELHSALRDYNAALYTEIDTAHRLGLLVVPDPVPTNAGHDRDWWVENANVNDAEDCEACVDDLCPVHYGIAVGIDLMARKIAVLGDDPELFALIPDPMKAPGGDDE